MPTLNWIGKDAVINHHNDVPFRVLDKKYTFGDVADTSQCGVSTENKIIHGDNLEALKALLPEYEGRIKCIYIDPPYNTGNENWKYNDNVNSPKIRKWLGQVVGKEAEDLTRHDKWLCMMYPRLVLLKKLLADDGAIFISIDDNEQANLKLICDEIFGAGNLISCSIRRTINSGKHDVTTIAPFHEYLLVYAKEITKVQIEKKQKCSNEKDRLYKLTDEFVNLRGRYYITQLNKNSLQYSDGLNYPIIGPDGIDIWPGGGFEDKVWIWRWSKEKVEWGIQNGYIVFKKTKEGNYKVYTKSYEFVDKDGNFIVRNNPYSSLEYVAKEYANFNATPELEKIFNGSKVFSFPKSILFIEEILKMIDTKDSIILDSFAGSGTTAHAVLNLNKADGGNRKFILVEMEDYAETITAERVRRVINGYGEGKNAVEGTGGSFSFYELGETIFNGDGYLNESVGTAKLREYIWYTETRTPLPHATVETGRAPSLPQYLLGNHDGTAYYFYYEPDQITTLSHETLSIVVQKAETYVVYADQCVIDEEWLSSHNIVFKKIPRDIRKF